MKPAQKRQWVVLLAGKFPRTERKACRLLGISRSTCRYVSMRRDDLVLRQKIRAIAQARLRFGYRRIVVMLRREGFRVGSERVRRLYREEGLSLRMKPKRRRKLASHLRIVEDKRLFWNSVAFYNYIQEFVGFGSKVPPTQEMIDAAQAPFLEVLNVLRPELIWVLGYRYLWDWLPREDAEGPRLRKNGEELTRWYRLAATDAEPEMHALALRMKHPSAGFSGPYWHSIVQEAQQVRWP